MALAVLTALATVQALPLVGFPDATPNGSLNIPNSGKFTDVSRGLILLPDTLYRLVA